MKLSVVFDLSLLDLHYLLLVHVVRCHVAEHEEYKISCWQRIDFILICDPQWTVMLNSKIKIRLV